MKPQYYLLIIGIALFLVMLVAQGQASSTVGSDRLAVILVIDDSRSINEFDPYDERIEAARSFMANLDESIDAVGLVSTQCTRCSYISEAPTRDFDRINSTLDEIKSHSLRAEATYTNIDNFLTKAVDLLKGSSGFEYRAVLLFSDGIPMDARHPHGGYTPATDPASPLTTANNYSIWVYTVSFGDDPTGIEVLEEISSRTRGEIYFWADEFDPAAILDHILARVKHSISVEKYPETSSGSRGTLINFTINLTNTGTEILEQITVTETLPHGLDYVSSEPEVEPLGSIVTWILGTLNESESKDLRLTTVINSSTFGEIINIVEVEAEPSSGGTVTATDTSTVTVIDASISVNKTSAVPSGITGTPVNFTIEVTNTGNATLDPVIVTDTLPEGLDYVSSTEGGLDSTNQVTWNLGRLEISESRTVHLEAGIADTRAQVLTNSVEVEGMPESGYSVTAADSADLLVDAATISDNASISVNKSSDVPSGFAGSMVNFTIEVANTGDLPLDPVTVTDTLPDGLDYLGSTEGGVHSDDVVTWNLGRLETSESRTARLESRIDGIRLEVLTNLVEVEGMVEEGYTVTAADSAEVLVYSASLSVNKTSDVPSGFSGSPVNFTIEVTNTGDIPLDPVNVTDTLPEGLDYIGSTEGGLYSDDVVTWNLGRLEILESKTVHLEARIDGTESGVLRNSAAASSVLPTGDIITAIDHAQVVADENRTHIVFALDTSGSMKKYYRLGPNESDDIVSGWSGFENLIVSIVSWDHDSEVVIGPVPLKGNETVLAEILDNLSDRCLETDLTFYDQGLEGSMAPLRDLAVENDGSTKLIVFLAGFSEFRPGERLDDYISEANRSGYPIFTIGVEINESLEDSKLQYESLRKISDGTGGNFYSVTAFWAEELNPVMNDIVREMGILGAAAP